ncbi:hypothetical protein [Clostridium polynesiense]|uniref:hypothetical protein n=1 Tax=Clostridium polynesiense TaxID=1325933 RepID=UPI00059101DF|nr:hypothetical protein [Clostridium polynesiense]
MKRLLLTLIGIMILIFTGCSRDISSELPNLKVTCVNQELSVVQGGYQWTAKRWLFHEESVIADTSTPDYIGENMQGDEVSPGAHLMLNFSKKPQKVTITPWGESKDRQYVSTNDLIIVPEEAGTYIFEIAGEWVEGRVTYTIKVIVSSK